MENSFQNLPFIFGSTTLEQTFLKPGPTKFTRKNRFAGGGPVNRFDGESEETGQMANANEKYVNDRWEAWLSGTENPFADTPSASKMRQWMYRNGYGAKLDDFYQNHMTPEQQKTVDRRFLSEASRRYSYASAYQAARKNSAKQILLPMAGAMAAPFVIGAAAPAVVNAASAVASAAGDATAAALNSAADLIKPIVVPAWNRFAGTKVGAYLTRTAPVAWEMLNSLGDTAAAIDLVGRFRQMV